MESRDLTSELAADTTPATRGVRRAPALGRVPLLALAAVTLFAGLWGGLLLLGLDLPVADASAATLHGPLMVFGFLGTLVALERAVALGRGWAYAGPVATGVGALVALASPAGSLGPALIAFGGAVLLAGYVAIDRIQRSVHNAVMALGAVVLVTAAVAWLAGATIPDVTYAMAGFLVLTIVGERIELSRAVTPPRWASRALLAAIGALVVGIALSLSWPEVGVRLAGAALLAQALWLARFDVARRTVRMTGLTRYMAAALIAGYFWLAVAGIVWLVAGDATGLTYDAALHSVFIGFVISMVFAHAPVIFPGVLRIRVPYEPRYYAHLGLLHASLALRVFAGDLAGDAVLWKWGGVFNEVAIVLFIASTATAAIGAQRNSPGPRIS